MKRLFGLTTILLLGCTLSACGNNNNQSKENSSLRAENSSLLAKSSSKANENVNKYKDDEYALAAYLKLQNQTASDLAQDAANMNWQVNNNSYSIDFGAHTTTMTVNKDSVDVTYDEVEGDHMGSGNGHKTYSKKQLNDNIKQQKSTIDQLLNNDSSSAKTNNSSAGNQQTQVSSTNSQTTTAPSDPDAVARAKGFKDVAGHSAAEWSQWEAEEEAVNSPENLARYQAEHGSN